MDASFGRAFHQAVERADAIYFALDGINNVDEAVRQGAAGFVPGNFTNAELHYIRSTPEILQKTHFYRNGEWVPSPWLQ